MTRRPFGPPAGKHRLILMGGPRDGAAITVDREVMRFRANAGDTHDYERRYPGSPLAYWTGPKEEER